MEPEIEKFEITDWDLQNEFNPNRIKRKLTKNQQIYGMWADDSDEDDRPGFGSRGKPDYSAPISFVSGGFKQPIKKETPEEKKGSSSEDEVPARPSFASEKSKRQPRTGFSGGRFTRRLAGFKEDETVGKGIGDWEKHTKGIGKKLLEKMGYQPGKGLGKDLQGISTPIEAAPRKGKGAIGLYGPEGPKRIEPTPDETKEEEPKEFRHKPRQWKKTPGGTRKVNYVYRSAEDVKAEGVYRKISNETGGAGRVKVIDMTGPEQRILSGYDQIHRQHAKPEDVKEDGDADMGKGQYFAMPELVHNLSLLVDMSEQDIIRTDRLLKRENDSIINLNHEEERLKQLVEEENSRLQNLNKVLDIVNRLGKLDGETPDDRPSLREVAETFRALQDACYEEYKMFGLSDLAIPVVLPMIKKYFLQWEPLREPQFGLSVFKEWKDILETFQGNLATYWEKGEDMDPYHCLVWQVWMPHIRSAVISWSVRHYDPMIDLLETWMPLLPPWVMDNILEQLIYPRLLQEVDTWNPLTDIVPIHFWLHPWLPLMGERLEPLYAPIRHKLGNALVNWHPSDCSAKLMLEPWQPVFSKGTTEAFVVAHVVPKLALAFQNFVINPHQQHLDVWHWVMAWDRLMSTQAMATLLEKNFFPQWLQVLCTWLNHNPNYEEVTTWYTGWKTMFSDSLLNNPVVKEQFKRALDIMNRAVTSPQAPMGFQPGARESMAYLASVERQKDYEKPPEKSKKDYENFAQTLAQGVRGASSAASLSMSFKDLIQKKAEEKNILFMPVPNRYQEGKQVHRFGHMLLYLDRGVIFVFNEKTWVPTSLQSLLDSVG